MSQSGVLASSAELARSVASPPVSSPSTSPEVRHVTTPAGIMLEYVSHGPADALPVVFLHGLSDTYRSFALLDAHRPAQVRTIAPSLRGHGESTRPGHGYTMRAMADDVAALMDALRIGPALIVGHSMGSRVALRLALDHPSHVRGLVLVGAFAPGLPNAALDELVTSVEGLPARLPLAFARDFQLGCVAAPVDASFLEAMIAQTMAVPTPVFRQVLAAFIADDMPAMLPRIDVPVLLAWGNRDAFASRADQQAMLEAMPQARLREYDGIGHTPHWECPSTFMHDVLAFCDGMKTAAGAPRG